MRLKYSIIIFGLMLVLMLPVNVIANPIEILSENAVNISDEDGVEICSEDHIVYYYRTLNGVLQYRRWNATRGYWIDATWLNA